MAKRKTPNPPNKSTTAKRSPGKASARIPEVLEAEELESAKFSGRGEAEDTEFTDAESESESEEEDEREAEAVGYGNPSDSPSTSDSFSDSSSDSDADSGSFPEPQSRGLVPSNDLLARYMAEVSRHPLLTPEEELELANRLRDTGDLNAAKRLVQANLRLVVKIAMEYRSYYSNLLDLVQEGNVGLMKAVSKFDPTKGARLGYYSSWWIRSYILKYLLDNFRLVKIGKTQAQKKLFYHLMREKQRLEAQGVFAGPKLLAEKLNVREKDVVDMEQRLSGRGVELSLDTPIDKETGAALHLDQLEDGQEGQDESLARQELVRLLKARLPEFEKKLNDKERRLLKERLLAEEPKTLQEVADHYGLTRERARQIEVKIISKLRDFLKDTLGRFG